MSVDRLDHYGFDRKRLVVTRKYTGKPIRISCSANAPLILDIEYSDASLSAPYTFMFAIPCFRGTGQNSLPNSALTPERVCHDDTHIESLQALE